jgi:hypothetical protein
VTDQTTTLRDRLRRAICEASGFDWDSDLLEPDEYGDHADAVLTVLRELFPLGQEFGPRDGAARQAGGQQPPMDPAAILGIAPDYAEPAPAAGPDDTPPVATHVCGNCDGVDPASCLTNPDRSPTPPDPTTADDPTPLRWGHGDVLHEDDGTVTVCLSGPDRRPYWLELDPARAQALRDDLAPPAAEARPPRERWCVEAYDADEWNPLGLTGDDRETAVARRASWARRRAELPTRLVRETTTWTVEEDETR